MFVGVIKTKDILLHPITIISMKGFKGFCKLLIRALSTKKYSFISMTQNSGWIDLKEAQKNHDLRKTLTK